MLCGLRFPSHFFPWCFAGHTFHNVFRNAFRYVKFRYVRDGGVLRCIRLVRNAIWATLCLWRCVGDVALAYTLELELGSEVGKWFADVSVLYNTVSTGVTSRHGDDTPIKLYVTQRFLLRFHNAFRYVKLRYGALRWCITGCVTVRYDRCMIVYGWRYVGDGVCWQCRSVGDTVSVNGVADGVSGAIWPAVCGWRRGWRYVGDGALAYTLE